MNRKIKMKHTISFFISTFSAFLLALLPASAQDMTEKMLEEADSARMAYDFPKAEEICQRVIEALDSNSRAEATEHLILAQNGLSMMNFCSTPKVVAKQTFPLKDFFLFYPLQDRSWRAVPNQLDTIPTKDIETATYIPDGAKTLLYSSTDENGIRNIYITTYKDTAWSVPALINEQLTSSSDEIFPMLSPDGKSIFFASKGLYGMGGYDLYVSNWNEENSDWDVPVNMGFPYSSPYDDFLFINTEDGKYSIFASNRECSSDSVCIYVLEYDGMPVRKAITDLDELRKLCKLIPAEDKSKFDNSSAVMDSNTDNAETREYVARVMAVRAIRDSIAAFNKNLDEMRSRLSTAADDEKAELTKTITEKEAQLPALNDSLANASKALQEIEIDFLSKGIVLDADKLQAAADREIVGSSSAYTFSKNSYGPAPHLKIMKPKPTFDYSFKILPEGKFAEDNTLPDGLIYQIQIFSQSRKATVAEIKGLSPVFEKSSNGRFTYSVGLFRTYKDVLSNLNKVKRRGFRSAIITAYDDGQHISVSKARKIEANVKTVYLVKVYPQNGSSLSADLLNEIKALTPTDLIKSVEDGSVVFKIGPLDDKSLADSILDSMKKAGEANSSIETQQVR
jgi:hypothetical protein